MALFFADECVATGIIEDLRSRGYDVVAASDVCPGEADDRMLELAATAGRIVITNDQGFGELAVRHSQPAVGVIILSLYELPIGMRK